MKLEENNCTKMSCSENSGSQCLREGQIPSILRAKEIRRICYSAKVKGKIPGEKPSASKCLEAGSYDNIIK